MRHFNIRDRVLLAALLPVILVATLLSTVFLLGRYADLGEAYQARSRSLVRQLASASEYGLFSGNSASLQALANHALREQDVRAVRILDRTGQVMVSAGSSEAPGALPLGMQGTQWHDDRTGLDVLVQPVIISGLGLDELYEDPQAKAVKEGALLGQVVVELSQAGLVARGREMLLIGLAVTLGGLMVGGILAVRIGKGVIRPILRVSDMIERIGRGELSVRREVRADDPLRDLQSGLNLMAEHLEKGRDELEQRIDQATSELRARKEEAETATRAKSRFLAAASHDLRQPIHALGMFVARLAQLPHDQEVRHLVNNLESSVRAMQDMLDALLDISRLDADSVRVHIQPLPLGPLLDQLRGAMQPVATEKGLRLRVRSCAQWVQSDPTLLHRIVLNLVSNGLRYTRKGGVLVGCRMSQGGRALRIEVWDTGVGIEPQYQQEVFKEFYQIGNPERDRSKGLGLGLNIVDRTARLLNHPLQLCSVPGRGTRFRIEVPLAHADASRTLLPSAMMESIVVDDVRGLSVLVVEDDRLSAQALRDLLHSWGCVVIAVDGMQAGLSVVAGGFMPDLIVSDYRLRAGETGLVVLHRLREVLGRPVPACLMSGDNDPELIQSCRDGGIPLLHKPVRPAKLRTLMRRMIKPTPD